MAEIIRNKIFTGPFQTWRIEIHMSTKGLNYRREQIGFVIWLRNIVNTKSPIETGRVSDIKRH